jgi:hypothetical protein
MVVTTTLDEGLPGWWGSDRQRTLSSTIAVYWQGERIACDFDPASKILTAYAPWPTDPSTPLRLRIHHANLYKHHNWPQRYAVTMAADDRVTVQPMPPRRARRSR